jgi:glycosyltransferase involved in cell wall biosynthesis
MMRRSSRRWRDVIANDIERDERRSRRVEDGIRRALDGAVTKTVGKGVAMVVPSLAIGGAETQLVRLAGSLARLGPVHVLVKHLGDARLEHFRAPLEAAGVSIESIGLERWSSVAGEDDRIPRLDQNLHELTRALVIAFERIRPAAVHGWMDEAGTATALAAVICGIAHIVIDTRSLRPTWFETRGVESIRSALRVLVERGGVHLVNNSRAGADDYRDWLQLNAEIRVVRNGFHESGLAARLRRRNAGDHHPVIGGIMRLSVAKRPDRWIDAARAFISANPSSRFRLWGEGPLKDLIVRRVRGWRLSRHIVLSGETLDVAAALGEIDVFLMTSDVEGTPNVVLEAQWSGVPVVALAVGGIAEAIAPELRHLLVENETALVAALSRALSLDRDFVRDVGQRFVRETFDPTRQLREYLALYGAAIAVGR